MRREQDLRNAASLSVQKFYTAPALHQVLRPTTAIELYVLQIYALLNRLDACFYSGAIVVEDHNNQLFSLLMKARTRERVSARAGKLGTHRAFMNDERDCQKWLTDKKACNRQFEIDLHGLQIACRRAERADTRNILLFYGFLGPDLNTKTAAAAAGAAAESAAQPQPQRYVYMKLETSSYASIKHVVGAAKYYGKKATAKSSVASKRKPQFKRTRREDEKHSGQRSVIDFSPFLCDSVIAKAAAYDNLMRKGAEFFLPQTISSAILRQVERAPHAASDTISMCAYR